MRVNKLYVFAFFIGVGAAMFLMRPNEKDLVRMHELSGDAAKAQALLEGLYEETPNNPQVIAALARQYRLTGRTEEAVRLMNRLCELEPHKPEHYEALIAFYYETYQTRRMLAERERLIGALESNLKSQTSNLKSQISNLKPQDPNLKSQDSNLKSQDSNLKSQISDSEFETRLLKEYRDLASLYSSHEQPYKQAELYKRAIQVLPREKSLTVDYINLLLSYQSPADLLPLLDAAVKNFPNDVRIVDIAIGTAFKQGDPARAEQYARAGIEANTQIPNLKSQISNPKSQIPNLKSQIPNLKSQIPNLKSQISNPKSIPSVHSSTHTLSSSGPQSAIHNPQSLYIHLVEALRLQQDDPAKLKQYLATSLAAWEQFGKEFRIYDTIDVALKKQEFVFAKKAIGQWKAKAPKAFAPWQMELYRYAPEAKLDEATQLELFLAARKQFPAKTELVKSIATLAQKLQRWELAARHWDILVQAEPEKLDLWQGYLHSLAQFDRATYKTRLAEALAKFDDDELHVRMQEEQAYHAQNSADWDTAIQHWEQLIERRPNHLLYYKNRMFCIQKTGDEVRCEQALLEAIKIFPSENRLAFDALYKFINKGNHEKLAQLVGYLGELPSASEDLHLALVYAYETLGDEERAFRQAARGLMEHPRNAQLLSKMLFHADSIDLQEQALLVLDNLAEADPHNGPILKSFKETALKLDRIDQAIGALKHQIALHPNDLELREALIRIYQDNQLFDELITERESFARLLEDAPIEPTRARLIEEYRHLVSLYRSRQRIGEEVQTLQRLTTLVPAAKYQRFEYLKALTRGRMFKEFEVALAQAVIDLPNDRTLYEMRVSHALRQGKFVEAERYATAFLKTNSKDRDFWSYLFVAIQAQPRTEANVQRLIAGTLEASRNLGYQLNVSNAIAFAKETNQIELVRLTIEKWVDQHPNDLDSWTVLLSQYASVAQLTDEARYELYTEALKRFPEETRFKVEAAYVAQRVKRWDFAAGLWRDLIEVDGKQEYYRNFMICLVHTGQSEELDQTMAVATEKYPNALDMREEVAFQKQLTKEFPYAARVWEQLIEIKPTDTDYYENLIFCYDQAGLQDKADEALARVSKRFNHTGLRTQYAYRLQSKNNWSAAAEMWALIIKSQISNLKPQTSNLKPQLSTLNSQISTPNFQISNPNSQISNPKTIDGSFEHHQNFLSCLYNLAEQKGEWNGAPAIEGYYAAVRQAHRQFPSHEPFQINAAYVAHDLSQWNDASALWAGLIKRHPDNLDYRKNRLYALTQTGRSKEYEAELIAALQEFPQDASLATDAVYALIAQVSGDTRHQAAAGRNAELGIRNAEAILNGQFPTPILPIAAISSSSTLESLAATLEQHLANPQSTIRNPQSIQLALYDARRALRQTDEADALLAELYEKHPADPNVLLRANESFTNKRDWDNAIATSQALVKGDPQNDEYRSRYRFALSSAKRWDALLPLLQEDIARNDQDEDAIVMLAYHYADLEQYELAMPYFERLVKLDPENIDYTVSLVYSYLDQQQLDSAQNILEEKWETLPGNIEVGALLADLYQKNGREDEALAIQQRLIASAGDDPEALVNVGDRLLRLNAMEEAEEVYGRALKRDQNNTRALRGLGRIKSWNNAPKSSLNYFERYVALVPEDIDARLAVAKLYKGVRSKDAAKKEFEEALRMLDTLEGRGERREERGEEAASSGPQSAIRNPQSPPSTTTTSAATGIDTPSSHTPAPPFTQNMNGARATALAGLGRIDEAIPYFAKLVEENPKDGYVYGDYAEALLDNKRHREAEDILAVSPKQGIYHLRNMRLKARSLFERRRYHQAAEVLEEVLIKAPRDMGVIKELAYFSEVLERWPAALRLYKTAWQDASDISEGQAETMEQAIRLMRNHNPQASTSIQTISSGADTLDHGRLAFSYPLSALSESDLQNGDLYVHPMLDMVELRGEFFQRSLKGPALFADQKNVSETATDFNLNAVVRPGRGLKFTLGVLGADNPAKAFMGAKAAAGYRQEDWTTEVTYKWRDHWFDPVRFTPFAGAKDEVRWDLNYFPKEWFNTYSSLAKGQNYLLAAPTGGPDNVFEYLSWDAGAELRVFRRPHEDERQDTQLWVTYGFSFQDARQETFYANQIKFQEERFTHTVGLRARHDIGRRFHLRAATGLGMDSKRDLSFGDLLTYQAGFTWHITDLLELRGDFLRGTETTLSDASTYTQSGLELLWRF